MRAEQIIGTSKLQERRLADKSARGKSLAAVQQSQFEKVCNLPTTYSATKGTQMLKLRSNYAKDRTVSVGDCYLRFNKDGIATVPTHYKDTIDKEMVVKPGRYFWLVEEEVQVPVEEVVVEPDLEQEMTETLESIAELQSEPELPSEPPVTKKFPKVKANKPAKKVTSKKK